MSISDPDQAASSCLPGLTEIPVLNEAVCQVGIPVVITDVKGCILYVNPAFEEFYGYTLDEAIGQTPRVIKSGKHHRIFYQKLWETITQKRVWHGNLINRCKNGSLVNVLTTISPIVDAKGDIRYFVGIQHDISKRIQKDQDERDIILNVSNAMRNAYTRSKLATIIVRKIRGLLGMGGAAILVRDEDTVANAPPETVPLRVLSATGELETWAGKYLHLPEAGISAQVLLSGNPYFSPDIHADPKIPSPEKYKNIRAAICIPLTANNQTIGVLWAGHAEKIDEHDINTLTALSTMVASALHRQALHDALQEQIQALQTAQTQIIHAEKLAAMGTLVAGIAHELNNPLTSIILYAQMGLRQANNLSLKRDLKQIETLAQRMGKIIRGMLTFAYPDSSERVLLTLTEIVNSVLTLLSPEIRMRNVNLKIDIPEKLPPLYVNESQLQQVFVNLLMNAFHVLFDQDNPEILLSAFAEPETPEHPPYVHILLQNNGPHIPEDIMPKIFDPFFTTKQKGEGSGLGLSISHSIIDSHGGQIWAENMDGTHGVRFHIQLPAANITKTASLPDNSSAAESAKTKTESRILLVDDEISILEVFRRVLTRQGYQVETTANSKDALDRINSKHYDLILCDIQMPHMNGIQMYQELENTCPDVLPRIVFISGDTVDAKTSAFMHSVSNPFLHKPLTINDLLEKVEKTLAELSTSDLAP